MSRFRALLGSFAAIGLLAALFAGGESAAQPSFPHAVGVQADSAAPLASNSICMNCVSND
jgi:hypothetical protein